MPDLRIDSSAMNCNMLINGLNQFAALTMAYFIPTPPAMNWTYSMRFKSGAGPEGGNVKLPPTLIMTCLPIISSCQNHFDGGLSVFELQAKQYRFPEIVLE